MRKLEDLKPGTFFVVIEEGLSSVYQLVERSEGGSFKLKFFDLPNQKIIKGIWPDFVGKREVYPLNNQSL